jgi:hypothetical protein
MTTLPVAGAGVAAFDDDGCSDVAAAVALAASGGVEAAVPEQADTRAARHRIADSWDARARENRG